MSSAPGPPRIAKGVDGAGPIRRLYRRSPLRHLLRVNWTHRGVGPDDVFVAAYPRSGSVWMRFLLVELISGDSSFARIHDEAPYVGHRIGLPILPAGGRLMHTHEPFVGYYRRAIHLVRDPRDVVVSYFHFQQRVREIVMRPGDDPAASFDHFIDAFLDGRIDAYGTWQTHLLSWTHAAEQGRVELLRVRYEDMRTDTAGQVMRMADWLGRSVSRDEAVGIAERCAIDRMQEAEAEAVRDRPDVFPSEAIETGLPVVREGTSGTWSAELTADQQRRFEAFADGLAALGYPAA